MKHFKWILLLVAAFVLAQGWALAGEKGTDGGFEYEVLEDGTACITGCTLSGDIVIPGSINGYTVSTLTDQLFYNRSGITSISVPATVIHLGKNNDEDNEFAYVFSYCRSLESINVDPDNPALCSVDGVLYNKNMTTLFNYPCAKENSTYTVAAKTTRLDCTSMAAAKNLTKLYIEGYDTNWAMATFYDDGQMTVYYKEGGGTFSAVAVDDYLGHTSDHSHLYPTFVVYGEPKPEPVAPEGELGYPTGLKAEKTAEGLKLTWKAAQNADQYAVRRQVNDSLVLYEPYARTTETSFIDTDIKWGNSDYLYHYWIEAEKVDADGKTTEKKEGRETFYVSFPELKNLTGKANKDGSVTLTWEKTESYVAGYEVYYSTESQRPDTDQEPTLRVKENETTVGKLEKGKTYYFYVRPYRYFWGEELRYWLHEGWGEPIELTTSEEAEQKEVKLTVGDGIYKITGATATFVKPVSSAVTAIEIPKTITAEGKKIKVTAIADRALKGCKKLQSVIIGANIQSIGKDAFNGCKKLKNITIKTTKLTKKTIGKNCFKGIEAKAVFKCPKKKLNDYKTWLKKPGSAPKKVKFK